MSEEAKKRGRPRKVETEAVGPSAFALAFAKSVWDSQSPDAPRKWRLDRVAIAMKNRGFSMDGVVL